MRLESAPDDVETLQAIFRAAHTIKGNAAGLGFPALARFAHALEDVLDRIRIGRAGALPRRSPRCCSRPWTGCASSSARPPLPATTAAARASSMSSSDLMAVAERRRRGRTATRCRPRRRTRRSPAPASAGAGRISRAPSAARRRCGWTSRSSTGCSTSPARSRWRASGSAICSTDCATHRPDRSVVEAHRAADRLFLDLQEEVMKIRMVPLGPTFRQFFRTVRDVATARASRRTLELLRRGRRRRHERHRAPARSAHAPGAQRRGPRHRDARGAARRRARIRAAGCASRPGTKAGRSSSRCRTTAPGSSAARIIARARAQGDRRDLEKLCPTASCSG